MEILSASVACVSELRGPSVCSQRDGRRITGDCILNRFGDELGSNGCVTASQLRFVPLVLCGLVMIDILSS